MLYPKLRRIWLTRKHSAPPCPYRGIPFHLQLPRYGQLKLELYTKTADAVGHLNSHAATDHVEASGSTVTCHLRLDLLGRRHYMIQSFADPETARLFHTEKSRRFSAIKRVALRKLIQMNRARVRQDLAVPPGNCLEALKGKLAGYDSIRINKQWRIIFIWTDHGPDKVSIVDHH